MKRHVKVLIAAVVILCLVIVGCSETPSNSGGSLEDSSLAPGDDVQSDPIPPPAYADQGNSAPVSIIIKGTEYNTSLESLDLRYMKLTNADIKPLEYMTNLTWLHLEGNQISDISVLADLTKLTNLYLAGNQISDISALSGLINLSDLGLSSNLIDDISALTGLTELWILNLSRNQISDISALAQLTKLWELWLSDNQISDASALEGLPYLSTLDLRNNQINDVGSIENLAHVPGLYLEGNQFSGHVILNGMLMQYNDTGKDAIIPDGVKNISREAFYGRTDITSVFIPDSVTSIIDERDAPYVFSAFSGCNGLINITVSEKNLVYSSQDGVLFNKEKTALILYPAGRSGGYIIPDGVKDICGDDWGITSPFSCDGLTSVLIPDSVEYICWAPFSRCLGLTEINVSPGNSNFSSLDGVLFNKEKTMIVAYPTARSGDYIIPVSVTSLGDYAFFNCNGLTSVVIPDGVTYLHYSVGDYVHTAFLNCINLTSVIIPGSVSKIDDEVFEDCPNITIHGYTDSEAQRYAEEKNIPFVEINP